jgi:hypothetical protein
MRPSADVTPRRFPPPWIVDETDAVLHRPRRHRDCGLLRRDSPTRSIRYVTHQKRLGTSHLAERTNKINHLSRREARRVTTEGKRRGKHRAELPRKQGEKNAMLGRRSKNSAAAIRATTTHARLEALELTLLAVLPLLPPASRAIVRSNIAGFMDEDITTPPASLVPTRHAQLFRDTLRGQMQAMIEAIDRAG